MLVLKLGRAHWLLYTLLVWAFSYFSHHVCPFFWREVLLLISLDLRQNLASSDRHQIFVLFISELLLQSSDALAANITWSNFFVRTLTDFGHIPLIWIWLLHLMVLVSNERRRRVDARRGSTNVHEDAWAKDAFIFLKFFWRIIRVIPARAYYEGALARQIRAVHHVWLFWGIWDPIALVLQLLSHYLWRFSNHYTLREQLSFSFCHIYWCPLFDREGTILTSNGFLDLIRGVKTF